jgi:hypothetical protein
LDLTRKTHNMPESAYLLDQMIRYVASGDFSPTGTIDPGLKRQEKDPREGKPQEPSGYAANSVPD